MGPPLEMMTSFRYLGQVPDHRRPVIVRRRDHLSQARVVWKRMTIILSREGTEPRVSGLFFKAVVQVVFLFVSETWVVTPRMGSALGGFQGQVARRLTGRLPQWKPYGKWMYTLTDMATEEAGFQQMEEYIRQCQNTVAQ